jgi:hypothetical protein
VLYVEPLPCRAEVLLLFLAVVSVISFFRGEGGGGELMFADGAELKAGGMNTKGGLYSD